MAVAAKAVRSIAAVARDLAAAHRKADPQTSVVKLFPSDAGDEIRLLEVTSAVPATGEILPFRFAAQPSLHVDYPSVVILLTPEEWRDVRAGKLMLPPGWDLHKARAISTV